MTVSIHLDVQALNALFPEGSEARAQLARGVIENFIKHHLKPQSIGAEITDMIDKARASAVREALQEMGVGSRWGETTLSDSFTSKLRNEARDAIRPLVDAEVNRARDEIIATIDSKVRMGLQHNIDVRINAAVRERVAEVVAGLVKVAA